GRVLLAEVIADALARVPLAVDHPKDQGHQPRHRGAERDRGEEPEALPVVVNVDRVGLAANLLQLFGRLVHSRPARCYTLGPSKGPKPLAMSRGKAARRSTRYNHSACQAKFRRSSERSSGRPRSSPRRPASRAAEPGRPTRRASARSSTAWKSCTPTS